MIDQIIYIHGINTHGNQYAQKLNDRLRIKRSYAVNWSQYLLGHLDRYARNFPPKKRNAIGMIRNLVTKAIDSSQLSALWVLLYEEPEIRAAILNEVGAAMAGRINRAPGTTSIAAHSLGSIIAIEALHKLLLEDQVDIDDVGPLILLGSPMHLWSEIPRVEMKLNDMLMHRVEVFNIYDKDDPIAEPLAKYCPMIRDIEVKTGYLFSAHAYFNDRRTAKAMRKILCQK